MSRLRSCRSPRESTVAIMMASSGWLWQIVRGLEDLVHQPLAEFGHADKRRRVHRVPGPPLTGSLSSVPAVAPVSDKVGLCPAPRRR